MSDPACLEAAVRRHHALLQRWLADGDREALVEFCAAHHEDFVLVTVSGDLVPGAVLAEGLGGAGGSSPDLIIEIGQVCAVSPTVVHFLETHRQGASASSVRRVTAVIESGAWLLVQETAVP
ncbi:MAG: hypothetical protein L0G99_10245 [Propionibacteriales bacterium]|nr:hypothetical protein [Propionibacteriales bacterium]